MHNSIDLKFPVFRLQEGNDVVWADTLHPNPINVLTNIHLAVVSMYDNAATKQRVRSTKRVVGKEDVAHIEAASRWIVVTVLGNSIWFDGKVDSRVSNVNHLQVANGAPGRKYPSAHLPIRDSFRIIGQGVWYKPSKRAGAQFAKTSFHVKEMLFEESRIQPPLRIIRTEIAQG